MKAVPTIVYLDGSLVPPHLFWPKFTITKVIVNKFYLTTLVVTEVCLNQNFAPGKFILTGIYIPKSLQLALPKLEFILNGVYPDGNLLRAHLVWSGFPLTRVYYCNFYNNKSLLGPGFILIGVYVHTCSNRSLS